MEASEVEFASGQVKSTLTEDQLSLLDDVLTEYGGLTAYQLEGLTHSEEPWIEARKGLSADESSDKEIPKVAMQQFYRQRLYGSNG